MLRHRQHIYFYIFSRATLNETYMAKYDGVLPRTPEVRPKSEIYTPKRDDEHPTPFICGVPPPGTAFAKWIIISFRSSRFLAIRHSALLVSSFGKKPCTLTRQMTAACKSSFDSLYKTRQDKNFVYTTHRRKTFKKDNTTYVRYRPPRKKLKS